MIRITRNWLRAASGKLDIPGPLTIEERYAGFVEWLPAHCMQQGFDRDDLLIVEYVASAEEWLRRAFRGAAPDYDVLTQLPTRARIVGELERIAALARRGKESPAVLIVDIDNFFSLNSALGHSAGDRLLRELGALLERLAGPHFVGRWGGDEFIVIASADR